LDDILAYIPPLISAAIARSEYIREVNEIRFCINKPVMLFAGNAIRFLKDKEGQCIIADKGSFNYIVDKLTGGSLYSVNESIRRGFVTLKGGHRVGICGTAVSENDKVIHVKDISALCFRVAREVEGCAQKMSFDIIEDGRVLSALIASPPGYGKTTMLRDICRILAGGNASCGFKKVGITDERGEIASVYRGIQRFDTGLSSFVCTGYSKISAMELMLRSMSPDVIVTDEIGSKEDFAAVFEALKCGVSVIASVHAYCIDDLKRRAGKDLRAFERIFFIQNKNGGYKMYRRDYGDY